jgi:predicted AAA+ superfamily ATPase
MHRRRAAATLRSLLRRYPAATIVGPRQCGKTTLAKALGGAYFDLQQERDRVRLDLEWDVLVAGRERVILDEAQAHPAVFPRLRGAIDAARKRNGRFLLLGSVSPSLMREVGESLAGRMAVLELTPFLWGELPNAAMRERLWTVGGFPDGGVRRPSEFPGWALNYLRLVTERDLPALGIPCTPQVTQRLLRMLAALDGQPWNASELGRAMGLNYQTVTRYVDFIEGAFLVRRLPPFHANIAKRLVKAPKIHWRDTGLLHATLGIDSAAALRSHPAVGASWESFVIEQALGLLGTLDVPYAAHHFRTSDGYELDLVLEVGRERWAVEVKLTSDPSPADLARLAKCAAMVSATRSILVSRVSTDAGDRTRLSCGLPRFLAELETLARGAVSASRPSSRTSSRPGPRTGRSPSARRR